jgi:hypothetical protein
MKGDDMKRGNIKLALITSFILANLNIYSADLEMDPDSKFTAEEKKLASQDPKYFTINESSIKIKLKEVKEEESNIVKENNYVSKDVSSVVDTIDKIVNIASKLWHIVQDNAPVSNVETKYAVALPMGINSAYQLSNWSKPKTYIYGFYAENVYGIKTIDVEYKVTFVYGGNYNGKGKFLTAVSVIPTRVDVAWGYTFNMHCYVPDSTIVNVGDSKNPVAALQLKLSWEISTFLKSSKGTSIYYVQGDGYFNEIASPFQKSLDLDSLKLQNSITGGSDEK